MKATRPVTVLIVQSLWIIMVACRNPFLPPTGVPVDLSSDKMRSTPQGVLNQLIESYENRQISLYEDLFPTDGSFRFFIAPVFFDSVGNKYGNIPEKRDPRLQFIGQSEYYYYWTQDAEVESHTRLFSRAVSIEFIEKPVVESVRKFVDSYDSLAEVRVAGGFLEIGQYIDVDTIKIWSTRIERQVFLLQKDDEDLWVISKWYDFSTNAR